MSSRTEEFVHTKETAKQVIENLKSKFDARDLEIKGKTDTGILQARKRFYVRIDALVRRYGVQASATAFEEVFNGTDYKDPHLYYNFEPESDDDKDQQAYVDDYIANVDRMSELFRNAMKEVEEEEKAERAEKREERKQAQEQLMKEYRRARKSLLQKARRHGVQNIAPAKPKRVTAGSVRRLARLRQRIK